MSLQCSTPNQLLEICVMKNGVFSTGSGTASYNNFTSQNTSTSGSYIMTVSTGDTISLCVENDTGANNIMVTHANITALRIGN